MKKVVPKVRQHYVPQFLLKNFAVENNVTCYDKTDGRIFSTNILNIAQEKYFYNLPDETLPLEIKQGVEDFLGTIDSESSRLISRLISNFIASSRVSTFGQPVLNLSVSDKVKFSRFIAYQYLRTREHRESLSQLNWLFENEVFDWFLEAGFPERRGKYELAPNQLKEIISHIDQLLDEELVNKIIDALMHKVWVLLVNTSKTPLIISDHPIIRDSHSERPIGGKGWSSDKTEVFVPLTPRFGIALLCPTFFNIKKTDFEFVPYWQPQLMPLDDNNVEHYNDLQFYNSYRYLFSKKDDFSRLHEIGMSDLESKNPYRQRIFTGDNLQLPDYWKVRNKKS